METLNSIYAICHIRSHMMSRISVLLTFELLPQHSGHQLKNTLLTAHSLLYLSQPWPDPYPSLQPGSGALWDPELHARFSVSFLTVSCPSHATDSPTADTFVVCPQQSAGSSRPCSLSERLLNRPMNEKDERITVDFKVKGIGDTLPGGVPLSRGTRPPW